MVAGLLIGANNQVGVFAGFALQNTKFIVIAKALRIARRQGGNDVQIAGHQRIYARSLVGNAQQLHFIQIGQPGFPVVRVTGTHRADAWRKGFTDKRPGTDTFGKIFGILLQNQKRAGRQHRGQIEVGRAEHQLHFLGIHGFNDAELLGEFEGIRGNGRVFVTAEGPYHIIRGQRFAIMEEHAIAQFNLPGDAIAGINGLGQRVVNRHAFIQFGQAAIKHELTDVISAVAAFRRVQRIRCRGIGNGRTQFSPLRRLFRGQA